MSIKAPHNDLKLLKALIDYESINKNVSVTVISKFINHLWYLSDELIGLSFFDDTVDNDTKIKMVQSLRERESLPKNLKRFVINKINLKLLRLTDLSEFV